MTVGDLIRELRELPQDIPIIADYKEITEISYVNSTYYIDNYSQAGYSNSPAVVLE